MAYNILTRMSFKLNKKLNNEQIETNLKTVFENSGKIYSYIVFNKPDFMLVQFDISDNEDFNTIDGNIAYKTIYEKIISFTNNKKVVCFEQPPLDIMIIVYDSFIKKLVKRQIINWPSLDYEDTYQLCMLTIVELYNKDYYLNKYLITTSFNNAVLMSMRKERRKPVIVNMEEVIFAGDNEILLKDTICDEQAIINKEIEEHDEYIQNVFKDVKCILINLIGERQFEQLYRDYSNKHTTETTRRLMHKVKKQFKNKNITWKSFNKYLEGEEYER